jgi:pimeloyl-ACP methyl ester carboxylesterase
MSNELKVGYRAVGGLQIRYADSDGSASQHLVLTSRWPGSLNAFAPIWPRLSGIARLLAIDLPGFGRSERRTDLLSPMAMSGFLVQILTEWDIADPHLVCPGIGTPAALFAAARHPGRIRSLVVGGGATGYQRHGAGTLNEQFTLLAGLLPRIFTPVQIITGRNDPIVPVANARFLHARLPNSRLDVLDAGRLPWEEASGEYGAIIAAWVNGGYLTGNPGMNLMC